MSLDTGQFIRIWAAATETELDCVRIALGASRPERIAGSLWLAFRGSEKFYLLLTGVGPVSAAATVSFGLATLAGQHGSVALGVCNIGLAGTFDPNLQAGQLVLVQTEIWADYGVNCDGLADARTIGFNQEPSGLAFGPVRDRLELDPAGSLSRMGLLHPQAVNGVSLTVAGVTAGQQRADRLRERHHPLIENMEGFGVAYACQLCGVPCLECRAVSNLVGERDKERWDIPAALYSLRQAVAEMAD